jgi:hypothetical protein
VNGFGVAWYVTMNSRITVFNRATLRWTPRRSCVFTYEERRALFALSILAIAAGAAGRQTPPVKNTVLDLVGREAAWQSRRKEHQLS